MSLAYLFCVCVCVCPHMGMWVLCWHEWHMGCLPRTFIRFVSTAFLQVWRMPFLGTNIAWLNYMLCNHLCINLSLKSRPQICGSAVRATAALLGFGLQFFYELDWTLLTLPEEVIGQCKKLLNTTTPPSAIQSLLMKVEPHWFPATRTKPQGVDEIPLVKLKAVGLEKLPWLTRFFFVWRLGTVPKEWQGVCQT